jgi:hypothetical protein
MCSYEKGKILMFSFNNMHLLSGVLFFIVTLQSCTNHYGHSSEEWASSNKDEKAESKKEYDNIINSRIEQDHTDVINTRTREFINHGVSH